MSKGECCCGRSFDPYKLEIKVEAPGRWDSQFTISLMYDGELISSGFFSSYEIKQSIREEDYH